MITSLPPLPCLLRVFLCVLVITIISTTFLFLFHNNNTFLKPVHLILEPLHVESGRDRAREREMVNVRKVARGVADELRRSIAADDHLDNVVRPAWNLPRLSDIARDASVLTPQS